MRNYSARLRNNAASRQFPTGAMPTRRRMLAMAALSAAAAFCPAAGFPLNADEAREHVQKMLAAFKDVGLSQISDDEFIAEFEEALGKFGDVQIIARAALGKSWRTASKSQSREFTKIFQSYLAKKYGRILRKYASREITIKSSRKFKRLYEVNSTARSASNRPINIRWMVSDSSGEAKLVDIILEGVSMLGAERSEIQAMLSKRNGDIDTLTNDLKARL